MSKPETITIDEVKYVRADSVEKQTIKPILEGEFQPFEIGAVYLIRTVTMIQVGRVVAASKQWVMMEDAAWVADTGRFSDALKKWQFNEVEPFPDGLVGVSCGSIVDFVKGKEVLRSQK
ncbi:MAG TPA: hypothetical protein VFM18_07290 [Methanosarcina sp.]|nr:hypothetical protein [Methanosarcina sp.]